MTVRLDSMPIEDALDVIARQAGVYVRKVGVAYVLGDVTSRDSVYAVTRFRRLTSEEIGQVLTGSDIKMVSSRDGLLMLHAHFDEVRQVLEVLAQLDSIESATWAVQFYLIRVDDQFLHDFGLDVTPAVDLGAAAAASAGGLVPAFSNGATAGVSLEAVLRAATTDSRSEVLADPFVLVTDGETATVHVGQVVPYRTTNITQSPGGPLQTQRVQRIEVGSRVEVACRELSDDRARLTAKVERSQVVSYQDNLPVIDQELGEYVVDVTSGGTYLVGHFKETADDRTYSTWLKLGSKTKRTGRVVQVWATAHRIAVGSPGQLQSIRQPKEGEKIDVKTEEPQGIEQPVTEATPAAVERATLPSLPQADAVREAGPAVLLP